MTEISVCIGSSCHLRGSYNIVQAFLQLIEENSLHDKVHLKGSFCMKECDQAGVNINLNGEIFNISPESAFDFFNEKILTSI